MRVRGRRVALLLAGALPLLADDDVNPPPPLLSSSIPIQEPPTIQHSRILASNGIVEQDENDHIPLTVAEAVHYDNFRLPSLNKEGLMDKKDKNTVDSSSGEGKSRKLEDTVKENATGMVEGGDTNAPISQEQSNNSASITKNATTSEIDQMKDDEVFESEGTGSGDEQKIKGNPVSVDIEKETKGEVVISLGAESVLESASIEAGQNVSAKSRTSEPNNATQTQGGEDNLEQTKTDYDASPKSVHHSKIEIEMNNTAAEQKLEETLSEVKSDSDSGKKIIEDDEENLTDRVSVDYASKSAGALILEKSGTFKGTSNLLEGDKDRYAIAPCEDKKFVVIGLSEDILVKTIKLANYERFSSSVKDFQVLGSQTMGKWIDLGTYTAKAGNGEQMFDLMEPAWARYLKFKFLSFHGSEYYCTISQIKVHGSTMLQGFHEQWEETEDEAAKILDDDVDVNDSELQQKTENSTQGWNGTVPDETDKDDLSSNFTKLEGNDPAADSVSSSALAEKLGDEDGNSRNAVADEECSVPVEMPRVNYFSESASLDDILQGKKEDAELFGKLFELIPSTLSSLPTVSIQSPGRKTESDLRTSLQKIGTAAIQSLYSSSQIASDVAKALISDVSGTITSPKMTETTDSVVGRLKTSAVKTGGIYQPFMSNLSHHYSDSHGQEQEKSKEVSETHQSACEVESESASSECKVAEPQKNKASSDELVESPEARSDAPKSQEALGATKERKPGPDAVESPLSSLQTTDHAFARILERLPSSDCLTGLDYAEFKTRVTASRKGASGTGGTAHSSGSMEPIFKRLTDEIKSLQISLSVHDQFMKASVACYQRVLLELVLEMETMRDTHEARISKLEEDMFGSMASRFLSFLSFWVACILSLFYRMLTSLFLFLTSLPGRAGRLVILFWPPVKDAILATEIGRQMASRIKPILVTLDRLHGELGVYDLGQLNEKWIDGSDQKMWLPVFPIILFLGVVRFIMVLSTKKTASLRPLRPRSVSVSSRVEVKEGSEKSERSEPNLISTDIN